MENKNTENTTQKLQVYHFLCTDGTILNIEAESYQEAIYQYRRYCGYEK